MNHGLSLGLLGTDARTAAVAEAARRHGDTIAIACDIPPTSPHAAAIDPAVPRSASWEPLLDVATCSAVLVGADGWSNARAEAVRTLVQAGRTLLLSHPLTLSMLWAYELDMIRTDSGARLIPCLPDRLHPFVATLRAHVETACAGSHPLGAVETISMERRMTDRTRDVVLRQLARDADLIRVLTGDPQRLATLGGGSDDAAWATLAVGFTGVQQVPVRWQVSRADTPGLSIRVVHANGATALWIPDDDTAPWRWTDGPDADGKQPPPFDRNAVLLAAVHRAVDGATPPPRTDGVPQAEWADAARAIELAETVPRSLVKGRAIDLHQEEFSELGTFKGTMASLGCGIVLAALAVVVLAALVGGVAHEAGWEVGERIAAAWPALVLTALVVFLALQLLPLLIGGEKAVPSPPQPHSTSAERDT